MMYNSHHKRSISIKNASFFNDNGYFWDEFLEYLVKKAIFSQKMLNHVLAKVSGKNGKLLMSCIKM